MSANLIIQWTIVAAIVCWALWFTLSRLGLFAWVMGGGVKRKEPKCGGCSHCGPSTGMQKLMEILEEKTSGRT